MYHYKIKVSYKGTGFFGWQIQNDHKTIQGDINHALEKICKSKSIKTLGASRTDAGVHAFCQYFKASIPLQLSEDSLLAAINSNLSSYIKVENAEVVDEKFHPISNVNWKEYWYIFSTDSNVSPLLIDNVSSFSYKANYDAMSTICKEFIGKKDFVDFYCAGSEMNSTIREILDFKLEKLTGIDLFDGLQNLHVFKVRGKGFLKQMVRLMVGTVWNYGRERVAIDTLRNSLSGSPQGKMGVVAPAAGLYLKHIEYR